MTSRPKNAKKAADSAAPLAAKIGRDMAALRTQVAATLELMQELERRVRELEASPLRENRKEMERQIASLWAGSPNVAPFPP